jgi:UDP-N-acetylmuramate--alanine ligase
VPSITKYIVTYGLAEDAQLRAVDVVHADGRMHFVATGGGGADLAIRLNLPGVHNVQNALAAIAVGREVGVDDAAIARALAEFGGVGRRFQRYGEVASGDGGSFSLIDDYGHHPAEMAATIAAVRGGYPGRRVVLAFQPHRYTTRPMPGASRARCASPARSSRCSSSNGATCRKRSAGLPAPATSC